MMPTPALFLVFSFLPRIVEGVGTALFSTASYAQLTQFYPDKKGTIVVSGTATRSTFSPVPFWQCSAAWWKFIDRKIKVHIY